MYELQYWLYTTLKGITFARPFMTSKWGWPICESLHFIGLSLLIGTIGMFDLRLLGLGRRIPMSALHRMIPWGIAGYVLNVMTGFLFLSTEPSQYIYNSSFHFKMLFMILAGLNVLFFYSAMFRRVTAVDAGAEAPLPAKFVGFASIALWTGVIVAGRLLTFYRPFNCPEGPTGFLATCLK